MTRTIMFAAALACAACNVVTVKREVKFQTTDNAAEPHRCREVLTKDGYAGTLEKTLARSAQPFDANNPPPACK